MFLKYTLSIYRNKNNYYYFFHFKMAVKCEKMLNISAGYISVFSFLEMPWKLWDLYHFTNTWVYFN